MYCGGGLIIITEQTAKNWHIGTHKAITTYALEIKGIVGESKDNTIVLHYAL